MNPYELLGLQRDATELDIRKAYRRLAKTAHPDVGGDPEMWEKLVHAHDVLTDPDLRARYDRTGELGTLKPDNAQAEEMGFIAAAMQGMLERIEEQRIPPERVDMLAALKQHINAETEQRHQQIAIMVRTVAACRDRFIVRDKVAEPVNRMAGMVTTMEHSIEQLIARSKVLDALALRALAVLERYEFRQDLAIEGPPPYHRPVQQGGWSIWSNRRL
jgi:hypothetical protein